MGMIDDAWFVYIVRCSDGTLYTGITINLNNRITAHNNGTGAIYTRSRRPVELNYFELAENKSSALKREAEIKKLTRHEKALLMSLIGPDDQSIKH